MAGPDPGRGRTQCAVHAEHAHEHGRGCGHFAVQHDDHIDFIHNGHLHHAHHQSAARHVDDHALGQGRHHHTKCTPDHACGHHNRRHEHGEGCGHPGIPHLDHIDHWVDGHLHHAHGDHCDNHGKLPAASA